MAAQPPLPLGAVLYKKDPNYYSPPVALNSISGKKKSTQLYRVDGSYLQCGWPGCLFAAKDLHIAAGPKHLKECHGYRNAILPSQAIRHNSVIAIDKATFDAGMRARKAQKHEKTQASRQPGYVPVPDPIPAHVLAQVQQAQAGGPQQQAPPNPPAQPAAVGNEDADGEQAT